MNLAHMCTLKNKKQKIGLIYLY